jgi:Rps23 Pro-64 3,4-dihydroxylase Tpa1-like proline 4-hydroxylase
MVSNELALGIRLYKNINLPCRDQILSLDFSNATSESIMSNSESRIDYSSRITLSIDIPYTNNNQNEFTDIFRETFDPVEKDYMSYFGISLKSHNPYKILKYEVGGKFENHMDDGGGNFRRVSTVYYLNDDYEGGELCFPQFGINLKPDAGDMIVFPSSYVYSHSVKPVISGNRFSIASWLK